MRAQKGVALVLVMWMVALLTALVGAYAASTRIEYMQGRGLHSGVVADAAARAGLEYALSRLQARDPAAAWIADGRPYEWSFATATVEIRIVDESARIDLNAADPQLLASLFHVLGVERERADAVAGAIVDWRDADDLTQPMGGAESPQYAAAERPHGAKNAPFETVGELEQVLGVDRALYELAQRHLTVFTGLPRPDQRFAGAEVLQALGVDPELEPRQGAAFDGLEPDLVGAGSGTYSVDSRARLADGRQAVLRAVVRTGAGGLPGLAYVPLSWEEGAPPR